MTNISKVEAALAEIRPFLQSDGGDILLVSVDDTVVRVKFTGFCASCNKSMMTFNSIAAIIKEKVPEITDVIEL
jgi:Fe-S cluster biogenesis protein NfuA